MGGFSPIHWIILAVIVLVLFGGGGKISGLMGDFAKGIKSFKKSMAEEETSKTDGSSTVDGGPAGHIEASRPVPQPQNVSSQNASSQKATTDARMAEDEPSKRG